MKDKEKDPSLAYVDQPHVKTKVELDRKRSQIDMQAYQNNFDNNNHKNVI